MIRKFIALLALLFLLLTTGGTAHAQGIDPVFQGLSASNVYVDPRVSGVDTQKLQQAAMQSQDNPHTPARIAILASLPDGVRSRNDYASGLARNLGLTKDPLVLVVLGGRGAGVEVVTTGLSPAEETQLSRQYASAIVTNPTNGTAALAQAAASEINSKEYRSTAGLWGVFLLVIVVIAALIITAGRKKKSEMATARGPINTLRENVLSGIEYLDGYMDVLPKNNPDSDQTRAFRQSASAKYEQAAKILDRATEMTDLNRAQTLLDQAQADVQSARRSLDRATGGTGNIPGDDALRPPPLPTGQAQVDAVPPNQRGVSFFSGRPAPLSSLVPVTVTLEGQSRQVLVTPEEADELRRGQMPRVLAFQQGGQYRPWYDYGGYDPYRDYWRYENSGWGGLGTGLVAGFVGAELLGGLMTPSYGMGGYPPYAFATDMPAYQGYSDPGGANFGNFNTDNNDYGGGADFGSFDSGSNGGGGDSGSDYGGGADFGGFDSGGGSGFDSGGGSDFGGGGDFGGGADFGGGDGS